MYASTIVPYLPLKCRLYTTWGSNPSKKKAKDKTKPLRIPII